MFNRKGKRVNNQNVTPHLKRLQFDDLLARFMSEADRRGVFREDSGREILQRLVADYTMSEELGSFIRKRTENV